MNFIKTVLLSVVMLFSIVANAQKENLNTTHTKDSLEKSFFYNGVKEYNIGDYKKAIENFKKLVEINPNNDVGYYYLSNCAIKLGDITSGELYIKKGIELDSTNFWYSDMLAQLLLKTKRPEQAAIEYENLIAKFPQKKSSYYNLVSIYLSNKDAKNARRILNKIETIQGKSENIALVNFDIFRMEQDMDGAINYLVKFQKEIPSIRIDCLIGDLYVERFNDSLATYYYKNALKQDSNYAPALYGLTEIYRKRKDFNNYFSSLNKVFANPESPAEIKVDYLKQLFQSTNYINSFSNNIDTLMLTLDKAHPKDSTATLITAAYFAQKKDYDKCAELLKKNYNNYPDSFSALVQYIAFFYQKEDWANLEIAAKEGLKKYPDNIDFVQLIGISQFRREMYNEAQKTYKQLENIALKKKDTLLLVASYSLLGDLAHELKNNNEAYSYYNKALKYRPNEAGVLNNYAYYLSEERKSLKKAYKMSKKSVELEPDNPTYLDTFGWILFLMDKPIEAKAQFKHAMLYGGKESAVILDHYADVLYKLKEYDLAFIYWEQADKMDKTLGIKEKIVQKKKEIE